MKFHTAVNIEKSPLKIDHGSKIITVGSCFTENMNEKFTYYLFHILSNPHGILYNPLSIGRCLDDILSKKEYSMGELIEYGGKFHSLAHHGAFSQDSGKAVLAKINSSIEMAWRFLQEANFLIITAGTAWSYIHRESNTLAGNCHGLPQREFRKKLLSVNDIVEGLNRTVETLRQVNPHIEIIFTISPVRHLRDGSHENQLSKSTLFLALEEIIRADVKSGYFPAYEIVMDELRDYRFYARDMVHPSEVAVDYVWEKFKETHISGETSSIMTKIEKIRKFMNHRVFELSKGNMAKHREKIEIMIEELEGEHPKVCTELLRKASFQD